MKPGVNGFHHSHGCRHWQLHFRLSWLRNFYLIIIKLIIAINFNKIVTEHPNLTYCEMLALPCKPKEVNLFRIDLYRLSRLYWLMFLKEYIFYKRLICLWQTQQENRSLKGQGSNRDWKVASSLLRAGSETWMRKESKRHLSLCSKSASSELISGQKTVVPGSFQVWMWILCFWNLWVVPE